METPPSPTLYINNINEKVNKETLQRMMIMIFSPYGKVVEVVCNKGIKLRGQAWVTFLDSASATSAMRGRQGFNFYDKPLRIAYAKEPSKKAILAGKIPLPTASLSSTSGTGGVATNKRKRVDGEEGGAVADDGMEKEEREKEDNVHKGPHPTLGHHSIFESNDDPHNVLFAQNLPAAVSESMLVLLFSQCKGYKELRLPPGNKGIAFVEFDEEIQATLALKQLHGHALTATDTLHLTYSKKL